VRGDKKKAVRVLRTGNRAKSHHFSTCRSGFLLGISFFALVSGVYHSKLRYFFRFPILSFVLRLSGGDTASNSWMGCSARCVRGITDSGSFWAFSGHKFAGVVSFIYQLCFHLWYECLTNIRENLTNFLVRTGHEHAPRLSAIS
jgi:hypothetical protein